MRIDVIKLDEIEPYMEFLRREVNLVRLLQQIKENSEKNIELLKIAKFESQRLVALRQTHHFKFKSSNDIEFSNKVRGLAR